MRIGVPRERREGERRVALVPDVVVALVAAGHQVVVETDAGAASGHADAAYAEAGATIAADAAAVHAGAELIARVAPPLPEEIAQLATGQAVISFLDPLGAPAAIAALARTGATALAMELVPRITRAQAMDALSSQATVAGYRAVLAAAEQHGRMFPLLMTAAGTVQPVRALILGAGVAGLQAIATARRLGALVTAFDVRPAVREQVESLGAKFLVVDVGDHDTETAGGYAKELSEDAHRREQEALAKAVAASDVVITTAAIPGRPAPELVTADAVRAMRPGSVIVDLAAETGGNCALTERGAVVVREGVVIDGRLNLPSAHAPTASQLYAKNVQNLLGLLARDGALVVDAEDEVIRGCLVCRDGEVVNERVRALVATEAGS